MDLSQDARTVTVRRRTPGRADTSPPADGRAPGDGVPASGAAGAESPSVDGLSALGLPGGALAGSGLPGGALRGGPYPNDPGGTRGASGGAPLGGALRRAGAPGDAVPDRGAARRMLLLHGLAANDSVWDAVLPLLPGDHEVWTARLPWSGEGIAEWGQDTDLVGRLDEALRGVPGGAGTVVAHSMSANVLLDLLDRTSRLGADPFARYGIHTLVLVSPFYRRTAEEFDWDTISYYLNDFHRIMEEGIRVHSGGRFSAEIQRAMGQRVRDRVGPYGWLRFFELYLRTPTLQTARITVPCLVLGGDSDFAAPPRESTALAAALPDARLRVLPGSGHFPMIEEAERFASEVRAFVNSPADADPQRGPAALKPLEPHR